MKLLTHIKRIIRKGPEGRVLASICHMLETAGFPCNEKLNKLNPRDREIYLRKLYETLLFNTSKMINDKVNLDKFKLERNSAFEEYQILTEMMIAIKDMDKSELVSPIDLNRKAAYAIHRDRIDDKTLAYLLCARERIEHLDDHDEYLLSIHENEGGICIS